MKNLFKTILIIGVTITLGYVYGQIQFDNGRMTGFYDASMLRADLQVKTDTTTVQCPTVPLPLIRTNVTIAQEMLFSLESNINWLHDQSMIGNYAYKQLMTMIDQDKQTLRSMK